MNRKSVFISGAITGCDNFKELFDVAEARLIQAGYEVTNPTNFPAMLEWGNAMIACLAALHDVDMLVDLPGWENSPGAQIEHIYAARMGKPVLRLEDAVA
ncbi:MAG: DUF4406 domain-containing protein [Oscillibacter sp.]|nr:DUF4406 domain-containing protein [Oscillibacter sp.]